MIGIVSSRIIRIRSRSSSFFRKIGSCFHYSPEPDETISPLGHVTSDPFFFLLSTCKDPASLRTTHAAFLVRNLLSGHLLRRTKLLSLYGSFGEIHAARKLFDRITDPDFYLFKVMIRWYFLNDLYAETLRFYALLRLSVADLDDVIFSIVLKACSELSDSVSGRKVHCQRVKFGTPDCFVFTGLIDFYCKCGDIDHARQVFDEIPEKTMTSWTCMVAGYVFNGFEKEGLEMFNFMRGEEEALTGVNHFTLSTVITACSRLKALHQGRWAHGMLLKSGMEVNSVLVSSLLDMYLKSGEISAAQSIFSDFSPHDAVSWTAMIAGYSQAGLHSGAVHLFLLMKAIRDPPPPPAALTALLSSCSGSGDLNSGMWAHAQAIKLSFDGDTAVTNTLTHMYSKLCRIEDASRLFLAAPEKDAVSWNAIIGGHWHNGRPHEALILFREMLSRSTPAPDSITLVSAVAAATSAAAVPTGESLHAHSAKSGLASSCVFVGTSLLCFYSCSGQGAAARQMFDEMPRRSPVTWNAMIYSHGMHGEGDESLALFGDMVAARGGEEGHLDGAVFTAVLAACSHGGMVGEGWRCLDVMRRGGGGEYPSGKHYAGVIDMLARAGRLEEAAEVMERMPAAAGVTGLAAFLHGCDLHCMQALGESAARRMLDLLPDQACYYVLLSNLYASTGRWTEMIKVREMMKARGMNKLPARSFVTGVPIDG